MMDKVETFGNSMLQHGKHNDRVYLMSLEDQDVPTIVPFLDELASDAGYTKIFAKVPTTAAAPFLANGYRAEANIPGFFNGEEETLFLGKYHCPERQQEKKVELVQDVIETAQAKQGTLGDVGLDPQLVCRRTEARDAGQMVELYRQVFASYPFPIHDPAYLIETMESHVIYYGIWDDSDLIALASAEMDRDKANAEMTDFATRPDCRGKGLANILLSTLEEAAEAEGIKTAYTIARSYSMGMNITFAKHDYSFSGTLTNNTNISGGLESMNVWHKPLA